MANSQGERRQKNRASQKGDKTKNEQRVKINERKSYLETTKTESTRSMNE